MPTLRFITRRSRKTPRSMKVFDRTSPPGKMICRCRDHFLKILARRRTRLFDNPSSKETGLRSNTFPESRSYCEIVQKPMIGSRGKLGGDQRASGFIHGRFNGIPVNPRKPSSKKKTFTRLRKTDSCDSSESLSEISRPGFASGWLPPCLRKKGHRGFTPQGGRFVRVTKGHKKKNKSSGPGKTEGQFFKALRAKKFAPPRGKIAEFFFPPVGREKFFSGPGGIWPLPRGAPQKTAGNFSKKSPGVCGRFNRAR